MKISRDEQDGDVVFGLRRVNADQSSLGVAGRQCCYPRGVLRGAVDFIKLSACGGRKPWYPW